MPVSGTHLAQGPQKPGRRHNGDSEWLAQGEQVAVVADEIISPHGQGTRQEWIIFAIAGALFAQWSRLDTQGPAQQPCQRAAWTLLRTLGAESGASERVFGRNLVRHRQFEPSPGQPDRTSTDQLALAVGQQPGQNRAIRFNGADRRDGCWASSTGDPRRGSATDGRHRDAPGVGNRSGSAHI